jgi:hypothetical protein
MLNIARFSVCLILTTCIPAAFAAVPAYADAVVSFSQGSGTTHPNFQNPLHALGAPDYTDPSNTGFGIGAVALGVGGTITFRMSTAFIIGGTSAPDLLIYEIGPTEGGTAERTSVSISKNGTDWNNVGVASGGTFGIDIDGFGFTTNDIFQYVRLADFTGNAGRPAGADIDAIAAVSTIPEPSSSFLIALGLPLLLAKLLRRRRVSAEAS